MSAQERPHPLRELCLGEPGRALGSGQGERDAYAAERERWSEALGELEVAPAPPPELWEGIQAAIGEELLRASLAAATPSLDPSPADVVRGPVSSGWRRALLGLAAALLLASVSPLLWQLRPQPPAPVLGGERLAQRALDRDGAALRALEPRASDLELERFLVLEQAAERAGVEAPRGGSELAHLALALGLASAGRGGADAGRRGFVVGLLEGEQALAASGVQASAAALERLARRSEERVRAAGADPRRLAARCARVRAYLAAASDLAPLAGGSRAGSAAEHLRLIHARARGIDLALLERRASLFGRTPPELRAESPEGVRALRLERQPGLLHTQALPEGALAQWWCPTRSEEEAERLAAELAALEPLERHARFVTLARLAGVRAQGLLGRFSSQPGAAPADPREAALEALLAVPLVRSG